jgi:hypothetical protein
MRWIIACVLMAIAMPAAAAEWKRPADAGTKGKQATTKQVSQEVMDATRDKTFTRTY